MNRRGEARVRIGGQGGIPYTRPAQLGTVALFGGRGVAANGVDG